MRIVVIGGGAIGSSVAMFLKREGGAAVDVLVIEPDPALTLASSALSAGSIRQQFSTALNVRMSQFGHQVITQANDWLGVGDEAVDLGFVPSGYLFLASVAGALALRAQQAVQAAMPAGWGQAATLLLPGDVKQRFDWLHTDDLALATLGEAGEGWFDGQALAMALARKARALGAHWRRARVTGFERHGRCLKVALLDDGSRIEADAFVCAAGPWSGAIGRLAGVDVPVHARRRTVFVLDCPTPLPHTPLVIDPSGVWFRSEGNEVLPPLAPAVRCARGAASRLRAAGRRFIGGWSPGPGDADPDDLPLDQPDLAQFEERLWPALAHRVPAFEALRVRSAWAGYYEVHPLDHNGLVGPHTELPNLVLACGFSGHGLQHSPATGRGVAEWLMHGQYRSLDLSDLGYHRVTERRPLLEQAII